jgi:hypothetical protein
VLRATMIFSDEAQAYDPLERIGFGHKRVNHTANLCVDGDAQTNTIEEFWSLAKTVFAESIQT